MHPAPKKKRGKLAARLLTSGSDGRDSCVRVRLSLGLARRTDGNGRPE